MNRLEKLILLDLQKLLILDSVEEFQKLLDEYDWHYFQSDKQAVYLKGAFQFQKIKSLIENNITFYFMYCIRADEVYNK